MLECDRIDVSDAAVVNKTTDLCQCIICNYWLLFWNKFRFLTKVCHVYHGVIPKIMSFIDAAIVYFKGNNYRIYFWYINEDESVNLKKIADLTEKIET